MQLTEEHLERIKTSLPVGRGNVKIDHLKFLNAILYMAGTGCPWRSLPKELGSWHTLYSRMNRWGKSGVLARVFSRLQSEGILRVRAEVLPLDGTCGEGRSAAAGPRKKAARKSSKKRAAAGAAKFVWWPQMTGKP